jgi:LPS-assembly lipoprotein
MSSPDAGFRPIAARVALATALACCLAFASGCTVRPLYATSGVPGGESPATALGYVGIEPATSREAQEVRNHLVFLLNGGRGEPAAPRYIVDLRVARQVVTTAVLQRTSTEEEPTAGAVTLSSRYRLTDAATGQVIATGRRDMTSSFDRPRQEFASLRAQRDAEDRAARELAEALRLALAQELERVPSR